MSQCIPQTHYVHDSSSQVYQTGIAGVAIQARSLIKLGIKYNVELSPWTRYQRIYNIMDINLVTLLRTVTCHMGNKYHTHFSYGRSWPKNYLVHVPSTERMQYPIPLLMAHSAYKGRCEYTKILVCINVPFPLGSNLSNLFITDNTSPFQRVHMQESRAIAWYVWLTVIECPGGICICRYEPRPITTE